MQKYKKLKNVEKQIKTKKKLHTYKNTILQNCNWTAKRKRKQKTKTKKEKTWIEN